MSLDSTQRTEVLKSFRSEGGDSKASDIKVNLTKASILAYCNTVGSSDDPIKKVNA